MTAHRSTEERREQILDAARVCFTGAGYHATKVQDITNACGLSKGALYFHFDSKRSVLLALVEVEFDRASDIFAAAEATSGEPVSVALRAFTEFLGGADDPRHRFFLLTGELAMQDDDLRERLTSHHEQLLARLASLLASAAERAGVPLEDPSSVAVLLKAMADGLQGVQALGVRYDRDRLLAAALGLVRGLQLA